MAKVHTFAVNLHEYNNGDLLYEPVITINGQEWAWGYSLEFEETKTPARWLLDCTLKAFERARERENG